MDRRKSFHVYNILKIISTTLQLKFLINIVDNSFHISNF